MQSLHFPLQLPTTTSVRNICQVQRQIMVDSFRRASVVIGVVVVVIIFISAMVGTSLRKLDSDEGKCGVEYFVSIVFSRAPHVRAKMHTPHKYLRFTRELIAFRRSVALQTLPDVHGQSGFPRLPSSSRCNLK